MPVSFFSFPTFIYNHPYPLYKMSKVYGPDLKKYMDKNMIVKLNGNRKVTGILRGYDQFMNLVIDNTVEEVSKTEKNEIGMVVIRGNSVVMMEPLEKV